MLQIRRNTFETNSSSTHSLTMCDATDFDKFVAGEYLLNDGYWYSTNLSEYRDNTFITIAQLVDLVKHSNEEQTYLEKVCRYEGCKTLKEAHELDDDYTTFDDILRRYNIHTYANYGDYYEECFEERYTTPSGDEVVAFGYYGYDN